MKIVVTGATGFLARHLLPRLTAQGHVVSTLGRRPVEGRPFHAWSSSDVAPVEALDTTDAVIHLAGETVAQRWTADVKRRIRSSRVDGTSNLVSALAKTSRKPAVLLAASAVGIYGDRGDEILTETSVRGSGFLADVTAEWESAARNAESHSIRVVNLRFGVILGSDGGAFPKMVMPFRLGAGGKLGSGTQWMAWAHVDDAIELILFALESSVRGAVNVTSPNPLTNTEFTRLLAAALHRPAFVNVPAFALRVALGEMSEAVLASVRAIPAVAQALGFRFKHADLAATLADFTRH